uniref:Uncharacterized protein n=1 Tax=Oryza punctata TaxID=4537 RepID=A0A0E0KVN8_ORYPU
MKAWKFELGSPLQEKSPVDGSSGLFQATSPPLPPLTVLFVVQIIWPLESDKTRLELFLMASIADEGAVIGLLRLATQTYVRSEMLLYHIPRNKLLLEMVGENKPSAKTPPSETSTSPSWSSHLEKEMSRKEMRKGRKAMLCSSGLVVHLTVLCPVRL